MRKNLCAALFTLAASLAAQAWGAGPAQKPEPVLQDLSKTQDVSGHLPEKVLIRTMTQSYCKYFEFALSGGRIYAKKPGEDKWELFLKTGLPFRSVGGDSFDSPDAIREISCDADTLYAFDDQGIMYTMYFKKVLRQKPFKWSRIYGFPRRNYVQQNEMVLNKRGWSMGARREEILWYEDRYGNQHHWGTMGLETFYFLTEDGQHIRFCDSGLPPDFSRCIECPEKGSFIAENISVSGDTIFLIGSRGTMYTRLIDFDTMGCDPMFFLYTYDVEVQKKRGTDYLSNYTAWALPAEDWARQAPIPLDGKARLTKMISIAQTGQGNYARELRVAGCNRDGVIGYWHKMLYESRWSFVPAELTLDESVWLDPSKEEFGQEQTISYEGYVTKDGSRLDGIRCFLTGPTLSSEDRCTFTMTSGEDEFSCTLFSVEKWTYLLRHSPGFDGSPRNYFVTPELDERKLEEYSGEFKEMLCDIFKGKNHSLFVYSAIGTADYYEIDMDGGRLGTSYRVLMTKDGGDMPPKVLRGGMDLFQPGSNLENPMDDKFLLGEEKGYTEQDRALVRQRLAENISLGNRLREAIKDNEIHRDSSELSRWGYNLLDLVTRITFLNRLNVPKIKQMTSFGRDIMNSNANLYGELLAYGDWTYPAMLELVDLRIRYYGKLLDSLRPDGEEVFLKKGFHNSFLGFYGDVGLVSRLEGGGDSMEGFSMEGMFPWFMIQKKDGSSILMRLEGSARGILDGGRKFRFPAYFTVMSSDSKGKTSIPDRGKDAVDIDSYEGEFCWDGKQAKAYLKDSMFGKRLIFSGSAQE